ncbi:transposase [Frankia sp. Cr2]|uniref:transposase n=1 Tax=Frankia sp. Cr2 TaxID=3073932 RepID=UPI002AD32A90|nr:transposase [Frankia sp. Cr2]
MQPQPWPEIPEATVRAARAAAYPLAMRVRDEPGGLFADARFAAAFGVRGRPGWSPGRLALVTVLQVAEDLTDRAAVARVRFGMDWNYALGMELDDRGFDASVLAEFRARLVAHSWLELPCRSRPLNQIDRQVTLAIAAAAPTDTGLLGTMGHLISRLAESGQPREAADLLILVVERSQVRGLSRGAENDLANNLRRAMRLIFRHADPKITCTGHGQPAAMGSNRRVRPRRLASLIMRRMVRSGVRVERWPAPSSR